MKKVKWWKRVLLWGFGIISALLGGCGPAPYDVKVNDLWGNEWKKTRMPFEMEPARLEYEINSETGATVTVWFKKRGTTE